MIDIITIEFVVEEGEVSDELGQIVYNAMNSYLSNQLDLNEYEDDLEWWLKIEVNENENIIVIDVYINEENEDLTDDLYNNILSSPFSSDVFDAVSDYDSDIDGMCIIIHHYISDNI